MSNKSWTLDMENDVRLLYPYLSIEKTTKVINKKHGVSKTSKSVISKAQMLGVKKEYSDGFTISEASIEIGLFNLNSTLSKVSKKLGIKKRTRGMSTVLSFSDFDKIQSIYANEDDLNYITTNECVVIASEKGIGRTCFYKNILSKCKPYKNTKFKSTSKTLYRRQNVLFYMQKYLESEKINYCKIDLNEIRQNDVEEFYSVTQVAKMLGVSRKVLNDRCGGDVSKVHPDIKYVKGKGGCMRTAQIPMRAIESIFDKLNEGWSYKNC